MKVDRFASEAYNLGENKVEIAAMILFDFQEITTDLGYSGNFVQISMYQMNPCDLNADECFKE